MTTFQTRNKQCHHRLALKTLLFRHTSIVRRILSGWILAREMPPQGPEDKGCTRGRMEDKAALSPWLISICVEEHLACLTGTE